MSIPTPEYIVIGGKRLVCDTYLADDGQTYYVPTDKIAFGVNAGVAVDTATPLPTADPGLGAAGSSAPAITGTGVIGWLRAIYEKVAGTLTIGGAVSVSNLPATQPVSGTISVSNLPATQPVSGSVNVGNFPATQPVSGSISVSNLPATQAISAAALPLPAGAATDASLATLHTDLGHLTDGTQRLQPATPTTFADAGTIAAGTYLGITIKNTSSTATAEIAVRQTNATGTILDTITLAASESVRETYPAGRVTGGTIYMQLVSGAVAGSVFSS